MSLTSARLGVALSIFALILSTTPGCHSSRSSGPRTIHDVTVGPSETQVEPEEITIWSNTPDGGDEVRWKLIDKDRKADPTRKLLIEFERPDAFSKVKLNANSHRFGVFCDGNECHSGPIAPHASGKFKYWQIVVDADGTQNAADGRIIIKP